MSARVEVYGVADAIRELRAVDASIARAAQASIKQAAEPIASAARSNLSRPALSGLAAGWSGKVTTRYGGRKSGDTRPLVRVVAAGRSDSIADMAGKASAGSTPTGRTLIAQLSMRDGAPSRFVWRAAEGKIAAVEAAVLDACRAVMAQTSQNLVVTRQNGG